eukprot:769978-Karenia_brevis.AAC.1
MNHLEIRDMWLQKEAQEGRVVVSKVPGEENPADLITKVLGSKDIKSRLGVMSGSERICARGDMSFVE